MFAVLAPGLLGAAALLVDTGVWLSGQVHLQVKADAAAMGSAYLLKQTGFTALTGPLQLANLQAVATAEAAGISSSLVVSIDTPTIAYTASSVSVTLTSQARSFFLGVFNIAPPRLRATATASFGQPLPCVLTLGLVGTVMRLDNTATVSASLCPITVDASLSVSTGTMSATAINVAGSVSLSGGGNSVSPTPVTLAAAVDPYAGQTPPNQGGCASHPDYTAYGVYTASPGTWCGNTTVGGNGSTISFNPGVYYVTGDLTFNNATITSANGVTFVVTGSINYTNYSNTSTAITAPTSGPTAGFAFWQPCGVGQTSSFQGGGTLIVSGNIYAPCSSADIGNNAQISAPLNGSMSFISRSLYVHGSASLRTASRNSTSATNPVLTQ